METKKPWLSKTMWLGVVTAVAGIASPWIPGVSVWLADPSNIQIVGAVWGSLAVMIRLLTKDKVSLTD